MPKHSAHEAPSNLEVLIVSAEARTVATALTVVTGGITLVAVAFALYALLEQFVGRPLAAGLTALAFALVTGAIAVLVPRAIRARVTHATPKSAHWSRTLRPVLEAVVVVASVVAEAVAYRRLLERARDKGPVVAAKPKR